MEQKTIEVNIIFNIKENIFSSRLLTEAFMLITKIQVVRRRKI